MKRKLLFGLSPHLLYGFTQARPSSDPASLHKPAIEIIPPRLRKRKNFTQAMASLVMFFSLLLSLNLSAQNRTISGSVKDEKGAPLSGVSVLVKNTKTGTTTAADG